MSDPLLIIADDHTLFRKGIIKALSELRPNYKVFEAENGKACLQLHSIHKVNVILLDIAMPEMNGFDVIEAVKLQKSTAKIIVLTLYDEPSLILKLISSGVHGYLPKNVEPEELVIAIEQVVAGKNYFPDKINQKIKNVIDSNRVFNFKISKKETEIIKLLAAGLTSKEIAGQTGYTERTVETKKSRIEKKFKVKNSAQIIDLAYKVGILTVSQR
jgi:two-component system, NarL family, response regulator NreC